MRTKNSIKNSITSVLSTVLIMIISFISQGIFVNILGSEYLGINGLFTNILSMLAIVELGVGPAILYNLYKPVAANDKEKIKSLIEYYKNCYRKIAIVICILSILFIPILPHVVGEINISDSIYIIFFLFVLDVAFSYTMTYKRSLLYANQRSRVINKIHTICVIVLNILQIIFLYVTKDYIIFLVLKIVFRIIENIVLNKIVNKDYSYVNEKNVNQISTEEKKGISTKVKGLLMHKIGSIVVLGTDNILISTFIGISYVGLYSNYYLVIKGLDSLLTQLFSAIIGSIGNLLVTASREKSYEIYKKLSFLNFILSIFATTCMLILFQPFITIWLGKEYLMEFYIVVFIVINFYLLSMRKSIAAFKEAAGIYEQDKHVPLIEALVNIVASLIFIYLFGLVGVFIGTTISSMLLYLYSYPKYVYKELFAKKQVTYIKEFFINFILAAIIAGITYYISSEIVAENILLEIAVKLTIGIIMPMIIIIILYRKKEEFLFFKNLILKNRSRREKK